MEVQQSFRANKISRSVYRCQDLGGQRIPMDLQKIFYPPEFDCSKYLDMSWSDLRCSIKRFHIDVCDDYTARIDQNSSKSM